MDSGSNSRSLQNVVENVYKAAVKQADFANEPEKVRIEILPPDSVDVILANALYFKGEWNQVFNASETRVRKFKLLNNAGSVEAPFMTKSSRQLIKKFPEFKVLSLPYQQGNDYERKYSMYIFLPNQTDGLPELVNKFCSDSKFLEKHIPYRKVPVGEFLIPKFEISFDFEAKEFVESLGFSSQGLTEMVDPYTDKLEVKGIFHKAFIQVNEKGTEAAAVTAAVIGIRSASASPRPIDFVADHPFMYVIREEVTESVIFVGRVLNPIQE